MKNLAKYNKLWVALVGAGVQLLTIYFGSAEWLPVVVAFLTAAGVYQVKNEGTK